MHIDDLTPGHLNCRSNTALDRLKAIYSNAAKLWEAFRVDPDGVKKAAEKGEFDELESDKRIEMFQRREAQRADISSTVVTVDPRRFIRELGIERVFGTNEILSVEFLERALAASRSIARIVCPLERGTGFLVYPGILLTNHHVLPDADSAAGASAEFDAEDNLFGPMKQLQEFRLNPNRLFVTSGMDELDFTLVAVDDYSIGGVSINDYGCLPLIERQGKILVGLPINTIHHPEGNYKRITIRNGTLLKLEDGDPKLDPFCFYDLDTQRGSSGAPIFNDRWEVVALHRAAVPKTNKKGHLIDRDGQKISVDAPEEEVRRRIVWVANQGVRVSRLVMHLKAYTPPRFQPLVSKMLDAWKRGTPLTQYLKIGESRHLTQPASVSVSCPTSGRLDANGVNININITCPRDSVHVESRDSRPPSEPCKSIAPKAAPKITYDEFRQMLSNPNLEEEQLRPYVKIDREQSRPFDPAVIPNEEYVTIPATDRAPENAMRIGNRWCRSYRHRRFRQARANDSRPVLVSEGDSWFQFPILIKDVIDQLEDDYRIWSVGAAGDTLRNMVFAAERPRMTEYLAALDRQRDVVKAFLFSAAGNDVIGEDEHNKPLLSRLLKKWQAGKKPEDLVDVDQLNRVMKFLKAGYEKVIRAIRHDRDFKTLPIIIHGYDYCFPGSANDERNPSYAKPYEWLGRPMREKKIDDPDVQRAIIVILIDRLYAMMNEIAQSGDFEHIHVVDLRNTLIRKRDWNDEIHATDEGYAKIAEKFRAVLRSVI